MAYTTLQEIISKIDDANEYFVVYAKRVEGQFKNYSEAILLELTEEESEMPKREIVDSKLPGFDYFLDVFLIKEILEDIKDSNQYYDLNKRIERIIHYAKFDA